MSNVESKVKDIVRNVLGEDYKDPKHTFEDLGADSLDKIEIVMALEDEFETGEIDSVAGDAIKTPQDAIDYVKRVVPAHRLPKVGA
jgi:acyl carrier protein